MFIKESFINNFIIVIKVYNLLIAKNYNINFIR